ncbi:amidohydrolase family protein [Isachenkonia alkalipeptolytica]|uniref:Guanine deaminase n=1 Tax=Isachenkonia alkalipeptolytica TaxID=2565777 RepID=A0AA43XLN5_9CLOT|nr:amidohydrolase family protein [Isachenkonia alkalipeptolytica]NBG89050.1 guanine deaminase [Isachenkonia alkalipeptolytica]
MTTDHEHITVYKGNIVDSPSMEELRTLENGYLVVNGDRVIGTYATLPEEYKGCAITDYGHRIILPGFVDLHFHAPQFANRGLGLDKELLPWLEEYTFPEESKFKDLSYAKEIYPQVVHALWKNGTTRSVIFGSVHKESTEFLLDLFIDAGLGAFVGKVNMDRNCPEFIVEDSDQSLSETLEIIEKYADQSDLVRPILTPRFVPVCSTPLMEKLGAFARDHSVFVQSHISENQGEVDWVKELHPDSLDYASIYHDYGLFGHQPTIMAHCVFNTEKEIELMAKSGVYAAHCPHANYNLASGIMPVRNFLNKGVSVGLGTDVGAGHQVSIPKVMTAAVQASKIKWLESGKTLDPLKLSEVFYMGTKGGGRFFGKVGSFEADYAFDALVVDDRELGTLNLTLKERLERYLYIGDDRHIEKRYVAGKEVPEPKKLPDL